MFKKMIFCLTFLFIAVFAVTPVAQSQTMSIAPSNQTTYDNWEPTNDGTITFTVAVGGLSAANISAGEIHFDFETVSNWPGICMNDGTGTDPDLNFTDTDQTTYTAPRWTQWSGASQNVVAAWNSSDSLDSFSMNITVRCKDYGAFGILRVKLYNTSTSSDVFDVSIAIPKDDNGNYIADKSDTDKGYTNPALDGETGPDTGSGVEENNNPGDGLVQFEEYRGFKVNGVHTRLDPTKKDIFIYSPTELGIGNASNLPSSVFEVHEILSGETYNSSDDRRVNYNSLGTPTQFGAGSSWYVQDTKALWIFKIDGASSRLGRATRPTGSSRNPVNVFKIEIYPDQINTYAFNLRTTTNINASTNAAAAALQLLRTIGHEIGHGVGLPHPWDASLPTSGSAGTQGVGWYGFADTSENTTNTVSNLIRTEAIAQFKGQTPTTNFLDTSGSSWTIRLNSYVANRSLTESLGSYTFEAGSSIMDYNIKFSTARVNSKFIIQYPTETFTQAVGPGIFRACTYHQLHNWEYQLLGDGVTPQTNPQWTRRTVSTEGSSEANAGSTTNSGNGDSTDGTNSGGTETNGGGTETNSGGTETNGGGTETNGGGTETNGGGTETNGGGTETNGGGTSTTPPGAPTDLLVSSGDGQVTLSWTAPSDAGDCPIDYYQYQYRESGTNTYGDWTPPASSSSSSTKITGTTVDVTGLTNGTDYEFQVRAVSSAGESSESDSATGRPQAPVIITVPAAPAWSDIPDPYNLTVGDYFCLDLSSYVSGSPTIARTLGRIPAGLSLSNGVLSGTVTTVETRYLKFTATNLGGSVQSEWVDIVVTAASTPTVTVPVWSDIPDPYNLIVGDYFSLDLNSYVSGSLTITKNAGAIPAGLSLSNGVLSGTVTTVESRGLQFTATNTEGSAQSEWVQIVVTAASTPTVTAPVWSDIPDPYTLTVGDYFSLDLNSYVTGSLTITKNAGAIPAGLSLSNGILNGTVTTVEDRSIQFTATNSAGSAQSEWVNIVVQAAQ